MAATASSTTTQWGDPDAFNAFYDAALPRVYGYFLARCGNDAAIAEDLTQETFLAAVRAIKAGEAIDSPLPWLFGIARHKLLDHYRRQARGRATLLPWRNDAVETLAAPELDPAAEADRTRVIDALDRLPEPQRAAVVLRHLDGLSVPEVAAALGKSVHAAESLLARGRAGLKKRLSETDHG
jgi:RNA polymerase sigma-70 factor (ECF subfamily)